MAISLFVAIADTGNLRADEADAKARERFAAGARAYQDGDLESALRAFEEARALSPQPMLLFNIAQCQRRLGRVADAIDSYRAYLRERPDAPNRTDVEALIAELLPTDAGVVAPTALPEAAPMRAPPSAPRLSPRDELGILQPTLLDTPTPPVYRRAWFWIVAGAVTAGAALTIWLLSRNDDPACPETVCPE